MSFIRTMIMNAEGLCVAFGQASQTKRNDFARSINGVNNTVLVDSDVVRAMGRFLQGKRYKGVNARTLVRQSLCMWIYQSTNAL
jgi:hypothetical protein